MCGIAGIWNLDGEPLKVGKLETFTDSLEKRGPDSAGYECFYDKTLGLGHRRLSILDLSEAGHQPMFDASKRYSIVYNGEIFNFQEIKKELEVLGYSFNTNTDTEVILTAYIHWGLDFQDKLNGMWAMAILDIENGELLLSRDRFGIKPFYFLYEPNHILAFASETRAFKHLAGFNRQLDSNILQKELNGIQTYGSGYTIYKNIHQILPGHFAKFTKGSDFVQKRWWNIEDHATAVNSKSLDDQANEYYELLEDACKIRLISDVKVGTALSGGLDSSSVYSIVHQLIKEGKQSRIAEDSQSAFVATFQGLIMDEREYAQKAVDFTGGNAIFIENKFENLINEITNDTLYYDTLNNAPITSVSRIYNGMKSNGVTVSLDGHGVDEMLYGYRDMLYNLFYYFVKKGQNKYANHLRDVIIPTYHDLEKQGAKDNLDRLTINASSFMTLLKNFIKKAIGRESSIEGMYLGLSDLKPLGENYNFDKMSYPDAVVYEETFVRTLPAIFRDFDRAGMQNSVEIRMPFMDWRLVAHTFNLPFTSKIGKGFNKLILREAMKGKMSEEIRTRTYKVGIGSPISHWMKGELRDWTLDLFNSRQYKESPITVDAGFKQKLESAFQNGDLSTPMIQKAWKEINMQIITEASK